MDLKQLQKTIDYKWREGPGGKKLAYIDARAVQDLLDEVVGPESWQTDFKLIDQKLFGGIGIKINTDWIWKWDCGTESNIEEEKGQVSDAFKRAAVQWGVGRFLYDLKPVSGTAKDIETKSFYNAPNGSVLRDSKGHTACVGCGAQVSQKVEEFSMSAFKKVLCMNCQKKQ